jgi:hypothetical protein
VACLHGALGALSAQDLTGLFGPAVIERTGGEASMASWLHGHHRLSPRETGRLVGNGRALEHLPALAAVAAAGGVSADAVKAIAPIASAVNLVRADAQDVDVTAVDAALARLAARRPHEELRQAVGHHLSRLGPDGTEPDPTEQRSLSFTRHTDGSGSFHGALDAIGGEKVQAAVESIRQASRPAGDVRTRARQAGTPSCSWPTTHWPPAVCPLCAGTSRTWSSPSTSTT